jgi:hypothetical protein
MLVELVPKTASAATVVSEHGALWRVVRESDRVDFSERAGPWLLIESPRDLRWVHSCSDNNFLAKPYGSDVPKDMLDQLEQRLRHQPCIERESHLSRLGVPAILAIGIRKLASASLIAATTLASFAGIVAGLWLLMRREWLVVLGGLGVAISGPYLLMIPILLGVPITALGARLAKSGNHVLLIASSLISQAITASIMALWFCAVLALIVSRAQSALAVPTLMWIHSIAVAPWAFLASKEPDNEYTHTTLLAYSIAIALVLIRFAFHGRMDGWSVVLYAVLMLAVGCAETIVAFKIDRRTLS